MACLRLHCDPNRYIQTLIYLWTTETPVHASPFKKVSIIRMKLKFYEGMGGIEIVTSGCAI